MTQGDFQNWEREKYFSKESKKGMKIYRKRIEKVDFSIIQNSKDKLPNLKIEDLNAPVFQADPEETMPENPEKNFGKKNFFL